MLLRTALLLGDGEPQLVSAAVGATSWAMRGWRRARQAVGGEWKQQGVQLMQPGVIDAWLFLTGGLLGGVVQQQQQSSLLFQVAATGRVVQRDSTAAQEMGCAGKCTCVPDKSNFTTSSSSFSCVSLDCASLMAVGNLLVCLGETTVSTMGVWCGDMPVTPVELEGCCVLSTLSISCADQTPPHLQHDSLLANDSRQQ